jgi:predicted RNA-binding protein
LNYWIVALPREDMEHCIKIGTFGLNRKYVLGRIQPGDKLACYITKECKIISFGEVTSEYCMDTKKIFKEDGFLQEHFPVSESKEKILNLSYFNLAYSA